MNKKILKLLNKNARMTAADIATVCPLARVMRRELKKRGIYHLKVVYSQESPIPAPERESGERPIIGSVAFVPSVMGLILAGEVIRDIGGGREK